MTSGDPAAEAPSRAGSRAALRASVIALVGSTAIMAAKFVAWGITGSTALLADAAESIINVAAGALVTYSVIVSSRPPDSDHPYGHGKAETLSALIEGAMILIAASVIVMEGIRRLVVGVELERLGAGIAISACTGVANAALGLYLLRVGRREDSAALRADGTHILTDVVTTAGGVVALILVSITGIPQIDPIVGLLVAVNILFVAWRLVRPALAGLLDEADFGLLQRLGQALEAIRHDDWCEIHQLRAWSSGSHVHVDLHVVIARYRTLEEAHVDADIVERVLLEELGERGDVVVHVDPCLPSHCHACPLQGCAIRSEPQSRRVVFDVEAVTQRGAI